MSHNKDNIYVGDGERPSKIPKMEKCQKMVEEFVSLTQTNDALAQFFLQDHDWDINRSLNAFYESLTKENENSGENDRSLFITYDSNLTASPSCSETILTGVDGEVVTLKPPSTFSLITWNLDGLDERDLKKRTKAVLKIIKSEKPDIVFLQEVIPVTFNYLETHLANYLFIAGGNSHYFTATLLCRTTVYFDSHVLHPFPNTSMCRNLAYVECHIGSLKLRLLNTHLESTKQFSEERKWQLRFALNLMRKGNPEHTTIFGGDLNLKDSEVAGLISPDILDLWVHCGQKKECQFTWDTLRNTNKTFPGKFKPRMRFDRVYLRHGSSQSVEAAHFGLVGIRKIAGTQYFPSDHWGIQVKFNIINQAATSFSHLLSDSGDSNGSVGCINDVRGCSNDVSSESVDVNEAQASNSVSSSCKVADVSGSSDVEILDFVKKNKKSEKKISYVDLE